MCSAHSLMLFYICENFMIVCRTVFNLQSGHKYKVEMTILNVQRAMIPKVDKPELQFIHSRTLSYRALNFCEVSWKYLERFPTYRPDTTTWENRLFSIFTMYKGPLLLRHVNQSCGSCVLHFIVWCFIFEISWKYLKRFSTYRADISTWWKWLCSMFKGQ